MPFCDLGNQEATVELEVVEGEVLGPAGPSTSGLRRWLAAEIESPPEKPQGLPGPR